MKRIILSIFVCAALLLGVAFAADPGWKFVIRIAGVVQCRKAGQASWASVWNGRLLNNSDGARTLEKSRAKILLPDNSFFILGQKTSVEMSKIEYTPQSRFVQLRLEVGMIRVKVEKFAAKDSTFQVVTPRAALAARGTEFYVEQDPPLPTGEPGAVRWYVFDGRLDATAEKGREIFERRNGGSVDTSNNINRSTELPGFEGGQNRRPDNPDMDLAMPGARSGEISPNNPYPPILEPPPYIVPSGPSHPNDPRGPATRKG
jgi:ferric-dicitrate binding protein FerR (iron transport regulator)